MNFHKHSELHKILAQIRFNTQKGIRTWESYSNFYGVELHLLRNAVGNTSKASRIVLKKILQRENLV